MADQDNTREDFIGEATMELVDPIKFRTIDELLSAYAIAYKANNEGDFRKNRAEIMNRVKSLREAKRVLDGVRL